MTDESELAVSADPEPIVETPEVEAEEVAPEVAEEAKKTEAAKRRERDKAHRARLVSDRDAAIARAQAAEAEAEKLRAKTKAGPPKEDEYDNPFVYGAAKAIWDEKHQEAESEAKQAGEAAVAAKREAEELKAREQTAIDTAWAAQREEAKSRYADFDTVALSPDVKLSGAMVDLIKTSDVGTDVAYFLGQNRDLAAQIADLNPVEAARAIGRIEASVQQPKPRTQTNAPEPVTPVRGAAGATRSPDKMSYAEFKAYREAGGKIG